MTPSSSLVPSRNLSPATVSGPCRNAQPPAAVPSEPSGSDTIPSRVMNSMTMTLMLSLPRSMLTCTYRRHRPNSSRPAKLVDGDLIRELKCLEHPRIGEHVIACDPVAYDRQHLERVQPQGAAGLGRVSGERGLPVGSEAPHSPARPAHLEHTADEQAVLAAASVPQRHRRHLQDRLIGEKPDERGNIGRLEGLHVSLDHRSDFGIIRFADLARITHLCEGSARSLQCAVDGR